MNMEQLCCRYIRQILNMKVHLCLGNTYFDIDIVCVRCFQTDKGFSPPSQGLEMFRMDETLCDVVLVPGDSDETFRVHRVIMASSSDYFKAMFTGGRNHTSHSVIKNDRNYPKHGAEAEVLSVPGQ